MADTATLQSRLDEVETAIHHINIGAKTVKIGLEDGRSVEYAPTSLQKLLRYRDDLRRQLGLEVPGVRSRTVIWR